MCRRVLSGTAGRAWRVQESFINKHDSIISVKEQKEKFSILWACKEAASKLIGLGMLIDFKKLTIKADKNKKFCCINKWKRIH